jgi:multiple sugar transport system substrate-binding protein
MEITPNNKFQNLHYYVGGIILFSVIIFFYFLRDNQASIEETSTKTIIIAGHISEAHQKIIERFNRIQKGKIQIKTVNLSFQKFSTDEQKELFARFLRSESDKIDIFLVDQIWTPRFAKWSEPLENHFTYSERQNFVTAGLEACSYGEHLVAIPLFIDIALMYYREDLLKNISGYGAVKKKLDNSVSWEDFIKLGLELKKSNQPFYTFQGKAYEGLMCSFIELMASQNMTLYRNHRIQLQTVEARKALQLLVDLVNTNKLSSNRVLEFEENQSYDFFIKNNGFFLRGWPNLGWHFKPDHLEAQKISSLKKTLLPHFAGQRKTSILGGWNLMVSKFSNNKPQAIAFLKYWTSNESQKTMYEVGGFLPANKNLYEDKEYGMKHPELQFYKEIVAKGFHRPFLKNYTKISVIISGYVNMALSNKIGVQEALKRAEEKINSDLMMIQ